MSYINTFFKQNTQSPPPLNRAPKPTLQIRSPQVSPNTQRHPAPEQLPDNLIEQFTAFLGRYGLSVTQLPSQTASQSANQLLPLSPLSILALSECEPRRNPNFIPQTAQDSGVVGVRFSLPATCQRTGAKLSPTPLATTNSTPPPQVAQTRMGSRRPRPSTQVGESPALHRVVKLQQKRVCQKGKNFFEMCNRTRDR